VAKRRDRGLRRGQGYVERRTSKDGTIFYVARWPEGGRYPSKVFRDPDPVVALDAAEQYIRDRDRALRTGRYIASPDLVVMDVVNQHLARGELRWKPNTYGNYCLLARNYIEPSIGKVRLREVDESRIQHCKLFHNEASAAGCLLRQPTNSSHATRREKRRGP
jgi:hypothetical protein